MVLVETHISASIVEDSSRWRRMPLAKKVESLTRLRKISQRRSALAARTERSTMPRMAPGATHTSTPIAVVLRPTTAFKTIEISMWIRCEATISLLNSGRGVLSLMLKRWKPKVRVPSQTTSSRDNLACAHQTTNTTWTSCAPIRRYKSSASPCLRINAQKKVWMTLRCAGRHSCAARNSSSPMTTDKAKAHLNTCHAWLASKT